MTGWGGFMGPPLNRKASFVKDLIEDGLAPN
jgi:hypothetical protein